MVGFNLVLIYKLKKSHIHKLFYLLIITGSGFISSCKKDNSITENFGYDYLVLDSGTINIYKFDSIAFDDNKGTIDTFNYYLKEVYSGYLINQNNEKIQTIERLVSKNDTNNWIQRESAFSELKQKTYERIDQNQRRIKLVFPLKQNAIWNGNVYNDLGKINYLLSPVFEKKDYSGFTFNNVIEVQEANQVNFIETLKEKSAYSKNVGLVYYESTKLSTQSNKTSGYSLKLTLISQYP